MTDLWQWFALGVGCGVGAVVAWRVLPFVALVLRAARTFLTCPSRARAMRADLRAMMQSTGERAGDSYPRWYIEWIAFRECAYL